MVKIKGVYDGEHVRLLEPVHLIPDTPVEVLIPESAGEESQERAFLERLVEEGLLLAKEVSWPEEAPFEPVPIEGPPLSQTIIEERR
ncbi:MAG: hypothetical protein E3J21_15055 [Anaerolineales bacterium]|nr:MAG: hypothetical protein E3J21_15055 [Anaerolineales bacterium]